MLIGEEIVLDSMSWLFDIYAHRKNVLINIGRTSIHFNREFVEYDLFTKRDIYQFNPGPERLIDI